MTTLSRSLGAHLGLLSMATSVMFSATPAAFAASATGNITLSASVSTSFTFTVDNTALGDTGSVDKAMTFGALDGGSPDAMLSMPFAVRTNNDTGYNVSLLATNGTCGAIMCSGSNAMPDKAWNGSTGTAVNTGEFADGLAFRMKSSSDARVKGPLFNALWGTDSTAELTTGFPKGAAATIINVNQETLTGDNDGDNFVIEYHLAVPTFQATGTYGNTATNPIVFVATTNI